jgi:hypothetical protein
MEMEVNQFVTNNPADSSRMLALVVPNHPYARLQLVSKGTRSMRHYCLAWGHVIKEMLRKQRTCVSSLAQYRSKVFSSAEIVVAKVIIIINHRQQHGVA